MAIIFMNALIVALYIWICLGLLANLYSVIRDGAPKLTDIPIMVSLVIAGPLSWFLVAIAEADIAAEAKKKGGL